MHAPQKLISAKRQGITIEQAWKDYNENQNHRIRIGKPTTTTVYINDTPVIAEIDTMGMVSMIHQNLCDKLEIKAEGEIKLKITTFDMKTNENNYKTTEPIKLRVNNNNVIGKVMNEPYSKATIKKGNPNQIHS